jgi:hypothetical protein
MYMSVGVMKDYKLKLRKLRASHTLAKSKKVDLCGQEGINPVEGCEGRLS